MKFSYAEKEGDSDKMRLKRMTVAAATGAVLAVAGLALAVSNAHFVGNPTATRSGNTLTVSGKVAGLGDVEEITVTVSATGECINPGSNKPQASNKEDLSSTEKVPVQNGKALFSIDLIATFQPDCSPPMTVRFSNVVVTVTAADGTNLVFRFPGTF